MLCSWGIAIRGLGVTPATVLEFRVQVDSSVFPVEIPVPLRDTSEHGRRIHLIINNLRTARQAVPRLCPFTHLPRLDSAPMKQFAALHAGVYL